ncbi:MAG: elongation factor G [Planctomycetota bacterium]
MTHQHTPPIERIRNVGISAHIDAGKTTLTERMLYYCGRIHQMREVHGNDGGATMDSDPIEKRRGITIASAATSVQWADHHLNVIDTPGHVDFTVEVERSLRVLDGAVLVLCGVGGVQSQTLTVDRQMRRYNVPKIALVNKMDRMGANPDRVTDQLRSRMNANPVALQLPIGSGADFEGVVDLVAMQAVYFDGDDGAVVRRDSIPDQWVNRAERARALMLESLALVDDAMFEMIAADRQPTIEQVRQALRRATLERELTPVLFASAFKNQGVQEVLDAIGFYLPSPRDREIDANEMEHHETKRTTVQLHADSSRQPVAMAFKTIVESFGQLTFLRVYQGTFEKGTSYRNARTGKTVRFGRLVRVHSAQRSDIDGAAAGDIVAVVGVDCASGDTFVGAGPRVVLENIVAMPPVVKLTVEPESRNDAEKLSKALDQFQRQDPTFRVLNDPDSGETHLAGMGRLHLDVYVERLREEYDCPVIVGRPTVTYKERPTRPVEFSYRFKKQNGGQGLFAQIMGQMEPLPAAAEEKFVFEDAIRGGRLSRAHVSAVRRGVEEALGSGPIDGFEVTGVKFTLNDGIEHE